MDEFTKLLETLLGEKVAVTTIRKRNGGYMCGFNTEDYKMLQEHTKKELEHHKAHQSDALKSISAYSEKLTRINKEIERCERILEVCEDNLDDDD